MQTTDTDTSETVTAFKAFDADFSCRGFQYAVGQTYNHDGEIAICHYGFHACENPMDVWSYYPIVGADGALTRYAEVELSGAMDKGADKIAAAQITIRAELRTPDFIRRAVDWVIKSTMEKGDNPSGDSAQIGSSGDGARIGSSGDSAQIGSSGDDARIGSSGYGAQIGSSGYRAQIGSSGDGARIGSSGDSAQIGSSGDDARIGSSGDDARIGSSGYYAQIGSSGYGAIIACAGSAIVTAGPGSAICIAYHDGTRGRFAIGYVGEDGIEAGKAYRADPETGSLVEVSE